MSTRRNGTWRAPKTGTAAAGGDLSLLETNLRRTPDERVRAHERALELAEALRKAGEDYRAKHEGSPRPTSRRGR